MDIKVLSQGGQNNLTSMGNDVIAKVQSNRDVNNTSEQVLNGSGEKEYTKKDLAKAVDKLNKFLEDENTHAEYEVHEKLNTVMIKIIDNNTKEIILEVPPKKILDMVAKLCEIVGVVFDKKA